MPPLPSPAALRDLAVRLSGELRFDDVALAIYSTDASEYQERPLAVAPLDPESDQPFNFCKLLAGSEGMLFFGVEYELNLIPLPPPGDLLCVHCASVDEALRATLIVMRADRDPDSRATACELIDDKILACTKDNLEQARNRSFVVGDPGAATDSPVNSTCATTPRPAR